MSLSVYSFSAEATGEGLGLRADRHMTLGRVGVLPHRWSGGVRKVGSLEHED